MAEEPTTIHRKQHRHARSLRATSFKLRWATWDDDSVVFNPASGDTHRLNLVESTTLKALCRKDGMEPAALIDGVAARLDIDPDESLSAYIGCLLEQFEELGLIELVKE